MSRDDYMRLVEQARDHIAEYLAWAEETPHNRDRYLGYARTRLADALWYIARAEREAA